MGTSPDCRSSSLRDVTEVRAATAAGARRFAVVGGGTFGIEAVDGLTRAGARVTLIEERTQLLPRFGLQIARTLEHHLRGALALHLDTAMVALADQPALAAFARWLARFQPEGRLGVGFEWRAA